jgi:hypothetical protein
MNAELLLQNLLSPPILFFLLGVLATFVRSDLTIPEPISRLFALYLLWAIGFKGGVALREAGLTAEAVTPLIAGIGISVVTPFLYYAPLRRFFTSADACALAACAGSVSVVTFITAANFLQQQGVAYGGQMVAALALMESPPIIVALLLHRRFTRADSDSPSPSIGSLLHEAVTSGPVFLLLGSLLAGVLVRPEQFEPLRAFTYDIFHGVLVLFLLEAGMTASRNFQGLREAGAPAIAWGVAMPIVNGALGIAIGRVIGLSEGDALLLAILSASASYIAVPAAMRLALPEANAGVYLPISLAVTFPFNVCLGIPVFLWVIRALWPDAA